MLYFKLVFVIILVAFLKTFLLYGNVCTSILVDQAVFNEVRVGIGQEAVLAERLVVLFKRIQANCPDCVTGKISYQVFQAFIEKARGEIDRQSDVEVLAFLNYWVKKSKTEDSLWGLRSSEQKPADLAELFNRDFSDIHFYFSNVYNTMLTQASFVNLRLSKPENLTDQKLDEQQSNIETTVIALYWDSLFRRMRSRVIDVSELTGFYQWPRWNISDLDRTRFLELFDQWKPTWKLTTFVNNSTIQKNLRVSPVKIV